MKAVIYARYSHGPNQTDQSIEGQLRDCKEYARRNDIMIVGEYIDRSVSGKTDNRAEFQRMLKDSGKKNFNAVLVWKIDRFGRNREEIAINKVRLRKNGVQVLYAKEHIPDGPEGIILESLLEGLAEYYSANLSQNIKRGLRESALKCLHTGGGLSLGYKVDADHKYYIDKTEADIVRLIFKMFDEGQNRNEILETLNDRGIKTAKGRNYTNTGLTRILRNRRYVGDYMAQGMIVPGGMPQIVDTDLFNRVQQKLDCTTKIKAKPKYDMDFLLTGKLFCGACGASMIGDSGTGKSGRRWYYYTCLERKKRRACKKSAVRKDWLEQLVVNLTRQHVLCDDTIAYIADKAAEIQRKEQEDKSMLRYYEQELTKTQAAIKNIVKAIEQGIITPTTKARLEELEGQAQQLREDIERERIERPIITADEIQYFLRRFKFGTADDKNYRKNLINTFVRSVTLYDDKIVITYNYSGDNNTLRVKVDDSKEDGECSDDTSSSPLDSTHPNPLIIVMGEYLKLIYRLPDSD